MDIIMRISIGTYLTVKRFLRLNIGMDIQIKM